MRRGRGTRAAALLLALLMTLPLGMAALADGDAIQRTETVYVTADASGTVTSVLSSVYLTNPDGRAELTDASTLTDVKNLLSNETPAFADGVWTFPAPEGKDVCYQGAVSADGLPVGVRITYELDGKPCTPAEIAGQRGHVRVTFRFENRMKRMETIGAESVELYTPFTVVAMLTLDDSFRSVTVQDARLMTDAGSSTILGTIFPGLAHNLDKEATGNLADSFSFEADVDAFALESATIIVLPDVLSADNLKDVDDLRDFADGVDELNDAGDKLLSGARSVSRGANTFAGKLKEFLDGLSAIGSNLAAAAGGAGAYINGISQGIGGAASTLNGIDTTGMNDAQIGAVQGAASALSGLNGGPVAELSDILSGISAISDGLQALIGGGSELQKGANSLGSGAKRLYRGVRDFCNDGLQQLADETGEFAITADRKDAMLSLSEAYTSYSATEPVENGSVKIVFTTDAVYVPKVEKTEEPTAADGTDAPENTDAPATGGDTVVSDVAGRMGDWFSQLFQKIGDLFGGLFK